MSSIHLIIHTTSKGLHTKGNRIDHHAVQAKADLLRIISTTEVTDENKTLLFIIRAWSYDVEGHAETRVENVLRACWKKRVSIKAGGNFVQGIWHLYLVRRGRFDLLWTVNVLARSVTKWNKASHTRLTRLISDINHTKHYRQFCLVVNNENANLDYFRTLLWPEVCKQADFCAFLDQKHVYQFPGWSRSKPPCLIALPNQMFFLWTQV